MSWIYGWLISMGDKWVLGTISHVGCWTSRLFGYALLIKTSKDIVSLGLVWRRM